MDSLLYFDVHQLFFLNLQTWFELPKAVFLIKKTTKLDQVQVFFKSFIVGH